MEQNSKATPSFGQIKKEQDDIFKVGKKFQNVADKLQFSVFVAGELGCRCSEVCWVIKLVEPWWEKLKRFSALAATLAEPD